MKDANEFLNESKLIEKALLKCYGPNGKSALVQTSHDDTFSSYFLSNDCAIILQSLSIKNNRLLILLFDLIKSHSKMYGDNCKTLFFYVLNALDLLSSSSSVIKDRQDTIAALRNTNMFTVYETVANEWNTNFSNVQIIEQKSEFLKHLNNICVMRDLNGFNRSLNKVCSSFLTRLIEIYMENELFENMQEILTELLDDLDHIIVYSDRFSLNESKLCENGFILSLPFVLTNWKQLDDIKRAIIILKEKTNECNANEITIEIKDRLEENLSKIHYAESTTFFPNNFLNELKANRINLILMNNCLTELQKAQLNTLNVSLISYLDYDFLQFLAHKLDIKPVRLAELSENRLIQISDSQNNIINLDSVENLDQTNTTNYFRLNKSITSNPKHISFVYFCSPIKFVYHQFKSHLRKVLRTIAKNLLTKSANSLCVRLIKAGSFEKETCKLTKSLIQRNSTQNSNLFLIHNFLYSLFLKLGLKYSNCAFSTTNQEQSEVRDVEYELLDLKLNLFMEFLYFVQNFFKIDEIHYHKSNSTDKTRMKNLNLV